MARPQERLPRLNIVQPMHLQHNQPMYSPALGTGGPQGFHGHPSAYGPLTGNPLQTPMQSFFTPHMPGAPGRPNHQTRNSISHFPGPPPPNGYVQTPVTGHFPRPSMMLGPGQPMLNPSGPHRPHKRQMSIGGPPKAVLGGPARKVSPNPAAVVVAAMAFKKKVAVNLPKETVKGEEGEEETRQEWARIPLPHDEYEDQTVLPPELTSRETFPPETWRAQTPDAIDVFLPGKDTWDVLKQQVIEAKLERLGVERGSGSNVPHIFAPHARAASISSPADPALLLFKLNKLHQAQSQSSSLVSSPQPPSASLGLTPPPNFRRPSPGSNFFQNRHGHTMSLAQPPTYFQPGVYDPSASSFRPFGSSAPSTDGASVTSDGIDRPLPAVSDSGIYAPQGMPFDGPPPLSAISKPDGRLDFVRGFGLDIPEEEEPEEEEHVSSHIDDQEDGNAGDTEEDEEKGEEGSDGETTAPHSQLHSRHNSRQHVARLSVALSLRSVGGNFGAIDERERTHSKRPSLFNAFARTEEEDDDKDELDVAAVQEWTGSEEEGFLGAEDSDDESLGEFSNPSDEERARRQRVERRTRRRAAREQNEEILQVDQPRRIPNFPRPPDTSLSFIPTQRDPIQDDLVSNPSEEDLDMHSHRSHPHHPQYLAYGPGPSGDFYIPRSASGTISPRHLPPLPHSRATSAHYSIHDPAMAHSRGNSEVPYYGNQNPLLQQHSPQSSLSLSARRESLNPFAKPFVFGKPLTEPVGAVSQTSTPPPTSLFSGHARAPSLGKPLNVAAPEFKPRSIPNSAEFTFSIPDAPQMPPPPPESPRLERRSQPLSNEVESSPAFKTQGREKRPRFGSQDSVEEGDSMTSFRFPPTSDSPQSVRRHHSTNSHISHVSHMSHMSTEPFTFEAFSNVAHFPAIRPSKSQNGDGESHAGDREEEEAEAEDVVDNEEDDAKENIPPPRDENSFKEEERQDEVQEFRFPPPSASKVKRAPVPLDFKHPVSNNTVPAGLFKALVNNHILGDERTRRGVRSRLGSREIFEHMHRPSMDDSNVQMISRGNRMVTEPVKRSSSENDDDVFCGNAKHARRNSSLPDALRDDLSSPSRSPSIHPMDLTSRLETQHISDVLAQLLDDKFASLRRELLSITRESQANTSQSGLTPSSEAMITDVVSLFRAQLQESATRSMEDSQMDARGEMDFQMIRDLIDEGHKDILGVIRQQIHELFVQQQMQQQHQHAYPSVDTRSVVQEVVQPIVESNSDRTTRAVVEAISEFSARQDAIGHGTPARERDLLLNDIVNVLTPVLHNIRPEAVDYDFLTNQLAQAVKPHISQLIDLASDKRETAVLIVDQLVPLLPSFQADRDAIAAHLVNEVRRLIAPIDPFEIKEQVADLVVERLDSRFAVRDKNFNVDTVTTKVTEGVSSMLENLNKVPKTLEDYFSNQEKAKAEQEEQDVHRQEQIMSSVSEIPTLLAAKFESLRAAQGEIVAKVEEIIASAPNADASTHEIIPVLEALITENKTLVQRNGELLSNQQELTNKVNSLDDVIKSNITTLQTGIAELITARDVPKRDLDDLRKLNSDYQIQLTKARAAHGQVRVEKDILGEKLTGIEAEREQLKKQVAELESAATTKVVEASTLEARSAELEEALAKALARLQDSDVATQAAKQRIAELEKTAKEAAGESQTLKSKVESLELQVTYSNRDKDVAVQALEGMKKQHDAFISQQSHWDNLRQASDKIDMLTQLIGQADNEELQDLRQYRDRTKPLEADFNALQKRVKDMETKAVLNERAVTTAKQTLAQAQQRSSEWERRARDYESDLEVTRTKLDQSEQTQNQLEADYALLRMQFDEQEADDRLYQDREQKQREQISALETKVLRLQEELVKAKTNRPPMQSRVSSLASSHSPSPFRPAATNGSSVSSHAHGRPESRASVSTVNGGGRNGSASDRRMSSYTPSNGTGTPPSGSVGDSMHAPDNGSRYAPGSSASSIHAPKSRYPHLGPSTPKGRVSSGYPSHFSRANAPSPSPSIVSAAPTLGDDGWWE